MSPLRFDHTLFITSKVLTCKKRKKKQKEKFKREVRPKLFKDASNNTLTFDLIFNFYLLYQLEYVIYEYYLRFKKF